MEEAEFILGLKERIADSTFLSTPVLFRLTGQNLGNLAFHHAIRKQLPEAKTQIDWDSPVEAINKSGTIGVIPSANQIGEHADYGPLGEKFNNLSISLVAIGLGAQAGFSRKIPVVPNGTLKWIQSIIDRAPSNKPNISVRGEFSLKVLEHYGLANHAVALGCPSLFINPDKTLGQKIAERTANIERIAVTAGHPEWEALDKIESSLANIAKATDGIYISQSPLEMVQMSRGEAGSLDTNTVEKYRNYICPEMSTLEFKSWCKKYGRTYFDISAWMEEYRKFDLVIGTRIHGIMLGIQAGIPAICVTHDSRTVELCETMRIPHIHAKDHWHGINRKTIDEKLQEFDPNAFDDNRALLANRYMNFLKSNHLKPAPWLEALGK